MWALSGGQTRRSPPESGFWSPTGVVTLDAHDRVVRAVVGFDRPGLAHDWARHQPGVDAVVLATAWTPGSDWAVVALDPTDRPTRIIARFRHQQDADLHARSATVAGYTIAPIDHASDPAGR
ncbi:hypothetical protein BBK14_22045 [Parafrankia soli]|uniref:Uncharacterized protein n=2 Tax=Parafrankia soli TaxID=2599596 RepID=A0A1S1PWM2_9ACTN|nr:hypothetical protein BBK14_22045 [Parafrankia soli]